jgi:hypothetical protein
MFLTAYEFAAANAVKFFGIVARKTTNDENTRERWDDVVDKQKSAPARAVRLADESGGQPPQSPAMRDWRDCQAAH